MLRSRSEEVLLVLVSVLKSFYTIYYSRNQSEIAYDPDMIHQENEKDAILYPY